MGRFRTSGSSNRRGPDDRKRVLDAYDKNRRSLLSSRDSRRSEGGRTFTVSRDGNNNGGNRNNGNNNGNNGGRGGNNNNNGGGRGNNNNNNGGGNRNNGGGNGGRGSNNNNGGGRGGNGNNSGVSRATRKVSKRSDNDRQGNRATAGKKTGGGNGGNGNGNGNGNGGRNNNDGGRRQHKRDAQKAPKRDAGPLTATSMDEMLAAYQQGKSETEIANAGRSARFQQDLNAQLEQYQTGTAAAAASAGKPAAGANLDDSLAAYMAAGN